MNAPTGKKWAETHDLLQSELIQYSDSAQMAADQVIVHQAIDQITDSVIELPLHVIPLETPLPCTLYLKWNGKLIVFRRQSERITRRRAIDLEKKGYHSLYIHKAFWRLFLTGLEEQNSSVENLSKLELSEHLKTLLIAYGLELERRSRADKKPIFNKMQAVSANLAENIARDPILGGKLLRRSSNSLLYFVNHSVNVAIYATLIAKKTGFDSADLKLLFYSALVHDIGDLYVPKEILYKKSSLTFDEMDVVQSHAKRGAELLISISSPGPVVQTALQHHERIDGMGYPTKATLKGINPFAKIVTIADVYDALTNNRPYESGFSPDEAIKKMLALDGKFDRSILLKIG